MKLRLLFAVCMMVPLALFAQPLTRAYSIPVTQASFGLSNPWAGGLNSAQVSPIDINEDGLQDLFIFDRIGSRISVFLNDGTIDGQTYYRYTREFNSAFPSTMKNWCLLRDYNCDGKADIFTNSYSGIVVYKNTSSNGILSFEPANNGQAIQANYDFGNPFMASVYCISVDIPSIDDFDGDGDLDIFAYTEQSTTIYYFKSMQSENGNCDNFDYICANRCYGMFGESPESFSLIEGASFDCGFNVVNPKSLKHLHTGGTLCQIDLDNNGLKDLIIGDVTETYLVAAYMVDTPSLLDSLDHADANFPALVGGGPAVDLPLFPAAFYLDVTNDNVKDLLVSTNAFASAQDRASMWCYRNTGTNSQPNFQFQGTSFLQSDMIDFGTNAYPVIVDFNADGLKDLLVTNYRTYDAGNSSNTHTSRVHAFENVGDASHPAFLHMSDNWLPLATDTLDSKYLAFGDDDGDGDLDLLVGTQSGLLVKFTNDAGSGNPLSFSDNGSLLYNSNNVLIDVGQFATPQYVDLDHDGKLDLAVGEKNGNVNYYHNIGSLTSPSYEFVEDTLGGMVATNILGIFGYAVPHFFLNENNEWEVLLGTETGQINYYTNVEGNLSGDFVLNTTDFQNINEGQRCGVWYEDITNDGKRDLFIGQIAGGLGLYVSDTTILVSEMENPVVNLFPNPTTGEFTIQASREIPSNSNLVVVDMQGRVVKRIRVSGKSVQVSLFDLPTGLYALQLNGQFVGRVLKN